MYLCVCSDLSLTHVLLPPLLPLSPHLQFDINQLMTSVNVSQSLSPIHKALESPSSVGSNGGSSSGSSVGGASGIGVEQSPVDRTKGFFPDESEPLLRCDSTSSKDSALSRNGSFITKGERPNTVGPLCLAEGPKLYFDWVTFSSLHLSCTVLSTFRWNNSVHYRGHIVRGKMAAWLHITLTKVSAAAQKTWSYHIHHLIQNWYMWAMWTTATILLERQTKYYFVATSS